MWVHGKTCFRYHYFKDVDLNKTMMMFLWLRSQKFQNAIKCNYIGSRFQWFLIDYSFVWLKKTNPDMNIEFSPQPSYSTQFDSNLWNSKTALRPSGLDVVSEPRTAKSHKRCKQQLHHNSPSREKVAFAPNNQNGLSSVVGFSHRRTQFSLMPQVPCQPAPTRCHGKHICEGGRRSPLLEVTGISGRFAEEWHIIYEHDDANVDANVSYTDVYIYTYRYTPSFSVLSTLYTV